MPISGTRDLKMDIYESTRVVYARIQSLEPENVSKIVGYLLLQDHGDREMIRLAFGPDSLIHSLINRAKVDLRLLSPTNHAPSSQHQQPPISSAPSFNAYSDLPHQFTPFSPVTSSRPIPLSTSAAKLSHSLHWENPVVTASDPVPLADQQSFINQCTPFDDSYGSLVACNDDFHIQDQLPQQQQTQILGLEDPSIVDGYFYPEFQAANGGAGMGSTIEYLSSRSANRRSPPLMEFPIKQCLYFGRGYCKHGSSCRFLHGQLPTETQTSFSTSPPGRDPEDLFSSSALARLEFELLELLRAKRTPISIASLPQLYYDRFGRTLQADGYLTESQRHGKTGYSLTKLLARLKNTIRVIDRPHGQHAVIAAEDSSRFTDYRGGEQPAVTAAGARQIYLTFPAESTFTEEDVSNYFRNFGPVQDVRIPCQQKRMFGFVTFLYAETVKTILSQGNPHFVRGSRVLVKPYREKGKLGDNRKYADKADSLLYSSYYHDIDPELHSASTAYSNSEIYRKNLMDRHDQALDLETRRLSELHLLSKALNHQTFQTQFMDPLPHPAAELKLSKDLDGFASPERFSYLIEALNTDSSNEKTKHPTANYNDHESQVYDLPESPFASPITSSISTAT